MSIPLKKFTLFSFFSALIFFLFALPNVEAKICNYLPDGSVNGVDCSIAQRGGGQHCALFGKDWFNGNLCLADADLQGLSQVCFAQNREFDSVNGCSDRCVGNNVMCNDICQAPAVNAACDALGVISDTCSGACTTVCKADQAVYVEGRGCLPMASVDVRELCHFDSATGDFTDANGNLCSFTYDFQHANGYLPYLFVQFETMGRLFESMLGADALDAFKSLRQADFLNPDEIKQGIQNMQTYFENLAGPTQIRYALQAGALDDGIVEFADFGMNCAADQIMKQINGTWVCADDNGQTYVSGTGIAIDAANAISSTLGTAIDSAEIEDKTIALADLGLFCDDGEVMKTVILVGENFEQKAWACADAGAYWLKDDTNIYYSAGTVGLGTVPPDLDLQTVLHAKGDVHFGSNIGDGASEWVAITANSNTWVMGVQNEATVEETDFFIGKTAEEDGIFHIEDGGNTGIGTSTPAHLLTVNGTIGHKGLVDMSDIRLKKHIEPLRGALSTIMRLHGVSFEWIDVSSDDNLKGKKFGFIAQDLERVLPELVSQDRDGYKSISYQSLIPLLVEALQQQQVQIDNLNHRLKLLETRL